MVLITLVSVLKDFIVGHWILVLTSSVFAIYWHSTRNFNYWKRNNVQGPAAIPFLGNFFSFSTPIPLLYKGYVKQYGKLFGLFQGQTPVLVLSDPEIIKRILVRDFALFRNRVRQPAGGLNKVTSQNLVAARDEEWKRIRSILTPMFTSAKLRKMEDMMDGCISSMLDSFTDKARKNTPFEARDPMGNFTMDVIAKCAFATETNAHQDKENVFITNAKSIFGFNLIRILLIFLLPKFVTQKLFDAKVKPIFVPSVNFFLDLSSHLIQERRDPKKAIKYNDMLQLMVNAEHNEESLRKAYQEDFKSEDHARHLNNGNEELEREQRELRDIIGSKYLSEAEIMAQALVFFLAGYETTASTLSYCLHELAINPDIQERLHQEIQQAKQQDPSLSYGTLSKCDYLDAVLSETLRKYPPALLLNRESADTYYIPEYKLTLEKGQSVNIPIYAIHHMEEYFPEPERFNPDRFVAENRDKIVPYSYLPFGGGPRNCIGMRFALTEAKMGLAKLVDQFKIVKTVETTPELKIKSSLFLLKTTPIKLAVVAR